MSRGDEVVLDLPEGIGGLVVSGGGELVWAVGVLLMMVWAVVGWEGEAVVVVVVVMVFRGGGATMI